MNPLNQGTECDDHLAGAPSLTKELGSHLASNAASWFPESDSVSVEGPVARRGLQVPPDPLMIGVMLAPGVATMSASLIVKDEVTGVTYMDTVTTSVERVALSGPETGDLSQGTYNTGHNGPHLRSNQIAAFGSKENQLLLLSG